MRRACRVAARRCCWASRAVTTRCPASASKPLAQVRPGERTTPAGRFVGEHGRNLNGQDIIWVDYDAAVSMHRVKDVHRSDRREQRLRSRSIADNRISYGCINIPKAFYEQVLLGVVGRAQPVVYLLPETRPVATIFKARSGAAPTEQHPNGKGNDMASDEHSFGVFKPVDHVVISFPSAEQADAAAQALAKAGLQGEPTVRRLSDRQMLAQIDQDLQKASLLASVGQEVNLVKAHRALAERGYHWLVVHAPERELAARVAHIAQAQGAERAQLYGNFIIEELIDHSGSKPQVAESPDRGLDAETPSGDEAERARLRAKPGTQVRRA